MSIAVGDSRCFGIHVLFCAWAVASVLGCTACAHCLKTSDLARDDGQQASEERDVSDSVMEQALPEAATPAPVEVIEGALIVGDVPEARPTPDVALEEEHPPETLAEAAKAAVPPPDAVPKRQPSFASADMPPAADTLLTPAPKPAFGVDELIRRLKASEAIGVFTKLAIRSEALDLMDMVKRYRQHVAGFTLTRLRSGFDGLLLKILALLNDDPDLSQTIYRAKEQLWQSLLEVEI